MCLRTTKKLPSPLETKKNVFLINVYFQKYNFSSKQCCCGYKCTRLLLFGLFHVHTFLVYSGSCQTNSWSGSTLLPLLFLPTFWKDFVQFSFFLFFLLKTGKPRSRECCLSGEQCRHMHPLWCKTDFLQTFSACIKNAKSTALHSHLSTSLRFSSPQDTVNTMKKFGCTRLTARRPYSIWNPTCFESDLKWRTRAGVLGGGVCHEWPPKKKKKWWHF